MQLDMAEMRGGVRKYCQVFGLLISLLARGGLRKFCLLLGLLISLLLLACQVSPHHVFAPLVPLFVSELIQTYARFGDPTRVAKPHDKDKIMVVLTIVVFCYFYKFHEVEQYRAQLIEETVAASIALFIFRKLKLNRNPIGERIYFTFGRIKHLREHYCQYIEYYNLQMTALQ